MRDQVRLMQPAAFIARGQHDILIVHGRQGQICRVAIIAVGDDKAGLGSQLKQAQEITEHHAFPAGIKLAPARHAMDIDGHPLRGQLLELIPGPAPLGFDRAEDTQVPGGGIEAGRGSISEHGELLGQRLPGWQAARCPHLAFFFAAADLRHGVPPGLPGGPGYSGVT